MRNFLGRFCRSTVEPRYAQGCNWLRGAEWAGQKTDSIARFGLFLIGDAVKGGLHGKHPSLTNLDQGDLKHHTDFRSVYTSLLEDWLHWRAANAVGGDFKKLKLFG